MTLPHTSAQVIISNDENTKKAYVRLNGPVSPTVYDFVLAAGERAFITDIEVSTVHVYTDATAGLRVVCW